jgi:hypothetical protein
MDDQFFGKYAVPIIVAILGSGSVSAIVAAIIDWLKNRKSPVSEGVQLLLQDRIEELCIKYIKAGEIKYENLLYLRKAHRCYHKRLGGNGDLNDLMEEVGNLPVIYPPKK